MNIEIMFFSSSVYYNKIKYLTQNQPKLLNGKARACMVNGGASKQVTSKLY
jgi:hypothetical protein